MYELQLRETLRNREDFAQFLREECLPGTLFSDSPQSEDSPLGRWLDARLTPDEMTLTPTLVEMVYEVDDTLLSADMPAWAHAFQTALCDLKSAPLGLTCARAQEILQSV